MTWDSCTKITNSSKLKLDDPKSKRHATFINDDREHYLMTAADGCWKKQTICADWVLTCRDSDHQVIVELKGSDVSHGVEQILATAAHLQQEKLQRGIIAGLIVSTRYPSIDTKIQRGRLAFKKKFNGPIHVVTKSQQFEIRKVTSFNGPL